MRERLYGGQQNAAPCQVQLDVTTCFAPLLRWIVALWQDTTLVLAIDATLDRNHNAMLVMRVLHGGSALPVACATLPADTPGAWMRAILQLLTSLRPAVPTTWQVLVWRIADGGARTCGMASVSQAGIRCCACSKPRPWHHLVTHCLRAVLGRTSVAPASTMTQYAPTCVR
jgi:hypothetical protein